MRKGQNPTVGLRHRSCPTVPSNIPKTVSPKQCDPKEAMHYPDRKISQILRIFATELENTFCL